MSGEALARQLRRRGIRDERVLAAFASVPRELFVPPELRTEAYADRALPIGCEQTISQPYIVAAIVASLGLEGGERVLDVGTGSGYQAAVLSRLAREVVTVERVPELAARARDALAAFPNVEVVVGDGTLGWPARAPYDGIAVAAAAPDVPRALVDQLAPGGRLVLPVGSRAEQWLEIVTAGAAGLERRRTVPCRFVPLLGAEGFAAEPQG